MNVNISGDGTIQFIYSDALQPMLELGKPTVRRASHVEPTDDGRWTADLAPVGGPVIGPFALRKQALEAEIAWLASHGF
ncbi:MAG: hypothetical protein IH987_13545 [Planctomycetes bacterium]|nr:hypothetical protein [Planctomycetota bacterium]